MAAKVRKQPIQTVPGSSKSTAADSSQSPCPYRPHDSMFIWVKIQIDSFAPVNLKNKVSNMIPAAINRKAQLTINSRRVNCDSVSTYSSVNFRFKECAISDWVDLNHSFLQVNFDIDSMPSFYVVKGVSTGKSGTIRILLPAR